ncbi:MAG TPA: amidase [Propylenella sp.]
MTGNAAAAERIRRWGIAIKAAEAERAGEDAARVLADFGPLPLPIGDSDDPGLFARLLADARRGYRASGQAPTHRPVETGLGDLLAQAESVQAAHNAFIEIFGSDAGPGAALPHGSEAAPLRGMPFAYKDVFVTPRRRPTAGVGHGHRWTGGEASGTIAALENAGAIAVGATNMDPWCYLPVGINPFFGRVSHPLGGDLVTGGSSSGSAVAVATGAVAFALGTDTGGSVRVPAALCGIWGLKTTHGLLEDRGLVPLSFSQDTIGLLGRDPLLIARVLRVLAPGLPGGGWPRQEARPPRIGIDPALLSGCDPATLRAFEGVRDSLRGMGAELRDVSLPYYKALNPAAGIVTAVEAASIHVAGLASHPEWYPSMIRQRLLPGLLYDGIDYVRALRLRGICLRKAIELFSEVDSILCPVVPRAAPRLTDKEAADEAAVGALSAEFLRLNRPVNYLGLPALAFPAGRTDGGHPVGLQLIGPPFSDAALLELARPLAGPA